MILTIVFLIMLLGVFGKLLSVAINAAWGITKIVFTIIVLPVALVALVFSGLIAVAFPILIIIGIVSIFTSFA